MARSAPDRAAVICEHAPDARGRTSLTFAGLNAECDALAWGLSDVGIGSGCRTLLGVRPGLDFVALTFALFKLGAIPVLIDPGMGRKNLLHCVGRAKPEALIAISAAHALKTLTRHASFKTVRVSVTVGRRWFWGGPTLEKIRANGAGRGAFKIAETFSNTPAAILFTSGGTGAPKGVCYEHGMFGAQVEAIREHFKIEPGEIDLPAFPLFALFSTALGTTCVIPDMNPSRPAQCNPDKLIDAIIKHRVTYSFGSPAIWKRVGPRCLERGVTLPSLKRILMAGAPVRGEVLAPFAKILAPGADVFIPYGATEALPISSIRGSEVLNETWALTRQGKGHCVGRPLPGMKVRIGAPPSLAALGPPASCRPVTETLLPTPQETRRLAGGGPSATRDGGAPGEILVSGAVVTKEYFEMPDATEQSKITDLDGTLWHRMGDMGYFDAAGRLWFCGRKAHCVTRDDGRVYYSVCCEAIFEEFMRAKMKLLVRAALVGLGDGAARTPAFVVEIDYAKSGRISEEEILSAWKKEALSAEIEGLFFYFKSFPVDVRHNAKINREALGQWANSVRPSRAK